MCQWRKGATLQTHPFSLPALPWCTDKSGFLKGQQLNMCCGKCYSYCPLHTHSHSSLPFPSLHIPSPHSTHTSASFIPPSSSHISPHTLPFPHTHGPLPPFPRPTTHTPHVHPSTNSPFRLMDKYTNTPHTPSSQIYKCIMHPYGLNRESVCVCARACVCACVRVCMHVLNKQPFPMMHPNHSHWRYACTEPTSMALHNLKRSKC